MKIQIILMLLGKMDTRARIETQIINLIETVEGQQNVLIAKNLGTQWTNASQNFQISDPRAAKNKTPMKEQMLEPKSTVNYVKRMAIIWINAMLWKEQKEKSRQQNSELMRSKQEGNGHSDNSSSSKN